MLSAVPGTLVPEWCLNICGRCPYRHAHQYHDNREDMMNVTEITMEELDIEQFISQKTDEILNTVGDGAAVNALSGGVDSATVTMLAHNALGPKLKTYFVNNGLMREGEPEFIVGLFHDLGVHVELIDARKEFFSELKEKSDPEEKREAITRAFYPIVFTRLAAECGAKFVFQGTNYTDIEETVAGIKRQHNIIEQLGIDPVKEYGYRILEPLLQLRKPAVRAVAKALGLPASISDRPPFPGPALAARVIGPVTPERILLVRKATAIVEDTLSSTGAFQFLAILHEDRVTGIRNGQRDFGMQIEVRCWESTDAKTATPTRIPFTTLEALADRIIAEVPGIVSVTYNITRKPPSTIEAV